MLTVNVHNDGKEKYQSFEAHLNEEESKDCFSGYGADKEEAISELKSHVQLKIKELQEINYNDILWVECCGKPI